MLEHVKNCGAGRFVSNGKWCHPDRVIDSFEVIFVTKGEAYVRECERDYHVKEGEILLLEPSLRHYGYKESENTEFFWFHWYGQVDALSHIKHKGVENAYLLSSYLKQLVTARAMNKGEEYMDCLTRLILLEICAGNAQRSVESPAVKKAVAWISANRHTQITEASVAKYCEYSVDHLNRLFKATYSTTLKKYINHARMEYIKELMLCKNMPLKEIAACAGFSEYKYFLKFFTYHEKATPSSFLKQNAYLYINSR